MEPGRRPPTDPLPTPLLWAERNYLKSYLPGLSGSEGCGGTSVEGDAGLAPGQIQDFVVRVRPWAQPGLMAVHQGRGLLSAGCLPWATLLAGSCLGSLGEALAEALRSGVGSSPSCRSTWSLALFGCARGEAAVTGTQNVTGLPARGVQMLSSLHRHSFVKDTTSFAPRGLILLGTF